MGQEALAALLADMAARVRAGDSFEGSIEYLAPLDEEVPPGTYALVRGSYRIGNSMGQGGVRLIGATPDTTATLRDSGGAQAPDPWVVIDWLAENMPRALELCPYKVRR
jgi:hypothetical protein